MRILLVHEPLVRGGRVEIMVVPTGLFSIASHLASCGHDVRIVHSGIERRLDPGFDPVAAIAKAGPGLVCLALHWTRQVRPVVDLARRIRTALPGLPIAVGGFTASYFAGTLARSRWFDYVIAGDGEVPAAALAAWLEAGRPGGVPDGIPNLVYRNRGQVRENPISFRVDPSFAEGLDHACFERMENFDAYVSGLQYADFDPELPGAERFLYRDAFFYNPGRGCPWRCTCCGGSWWSDRMIGCRAGFFHYSTDKAVRDVSKARVLGCRTLRISFDPEPGRKRLVDLFDRLRAGPDPMRLVFDCFTLPRPSFVEAVARTFSLDSILVVSAECGSESLRRRIRGPSFGNDALLESLRLVDRAGLLGHVFLSVGLPGETAADIDETERLIRRIRERTAAGITICPTDLDPGSLLYENPERHAARLGPRTLEDFYREPFDGSRVWCASEACPDVRGTIERLRNAAA